MPTTLFFRGLMLFVFAIYASASIASDSSPQPTTSPTNSRTVEVGKKGIDRFINARSTIIKAIAEYRTLVKQTEKGASRAQKSRMSALLKKIKAQAKTVRSYSVKLGDNAGKNIADRLILDDDVGGRKSIARQLGDLSDKLGLLDPVVYR